MRSFASLRMTKNDPLATLPADRRDRARSALTAVFGAAPVSVAQPITTGASASIHRIEVGGRPWLLRLESSQRDEVRDPERAYACMQRAAEAGIAPAVLHADAAAGVAIMAFVQGRPLDDFPGGPEALARALGTVAARLQDTPVFPAVADYPSIIGGLLDRLQATRLYGALLAPHRDGFERLRAAYPWDEQRLVSSHNDPHPGNILFDGERLWLIDWETAYRNDPALDLAIMTMYRAATPELQEALLQAWSGRPSDPVLRARVFLMRQLAKLFYGCANGLYLSETRPDLVETDMAAPTPTEFSAAIRDGRLIQNSAEAQRVGGKVALRTFLDGVTSPAFDEAALLLGARHSVARS
jgi:aminoglycoside phosphotransferase (APT) family kinase protein